MPQNAFFPRTRDLLVSQKIMETLFFAIHPLSPVIFAVATLVALVLLVNSGLNLLYTVWSNAYSEIGPEVTLQPLETSCAKDYKGHPLVQTSLTELPNSELQCQWSESFTSCASKNKRLSVVDFCCNQCCCFYKSCSMFCEQCFCLGWSKMFLKYKNHATLI